MAKDITTRYYALDLKTGVTYGIKLDAEGNCTAVQAMKTVIRNQQDQDSLTFDPLDVNPNVMPFGQTITAFEVNGNKLGQAFTMVWPTEQEFAAGKRPLVSKKELPQDLIKAGIAPAPKTGPKTTSIGLNETELQEALRPIEHMIGLDNAKRDIKQNIALALFDQNRQELGLSVNPISRHMVFTGNPGTGKTTFAREVAKIYHALGFLEKPEVHEVKREDLVAGYVGQTALKTKEQIDKAKGGVLFIDEAYSLARTGLGTDNDFGKEAIDTLVAAMENMRDNLVVIVAGYTEPMKKFIDANPGLKSRFMTYIEFEDYTMPQLGQILDTMLQDRGYKLDADARALAMDMLEKEKSRTNAGGKKDFGNGRTVRNLVEKAEKELAERLNNTGVLAAGHAGLNDEQRRAALTTITLADISGVSLESITSSKIAAPFGYPAPKKEAALAFNGVAANDDAAPAKAPRRRKAGPTPG